MAQLSFLSYMTQEFVAEALGVSRQAVFKGETGFKGGNAPIWHTAFCRRCRENPIASGKAREFEAAGKQGVYVYPVFHCVIIYLKINVP